MAITINWSQDSRGVLKPISWASMAISFEASVYLEIAGDLDVICQKMVGQLISQCK